MLTEKNEKIRKAYNILEIISKDDKARAAYEAKNIIRINKLNNFCNPKIWGYKIGISQ